MRAQFQTPGRKATKLRKVYLLFKKSLIRNFFFLITCLKESRKRVDLRPLIQVLNPVDTALSLQPLVQQLLL